MAKELLKGCYSQHKPADKTRRLMMATVYIYSLYPMERSGGVLITASNLSVKLCH